MTKPIAFIILFMLIQSAWAEKDTVIGLSSKITTLDPRKSTSQPHYLFHSNTHERLFLEVYKGVRPGSDIKKVLVKNISLDENQNYIIELKKGILFHDGIELDADDLIFTISSIKALKPEPDYLPLVEGAIDIEKLDSHTVRIRKKPEAIELLSNLGKLFIISKRARFSNDGSIEINENYHNPGTGPYKLVSSQDNNTFHFERFEKYHAEKPGIKHADIKYFSNNNQRLAALKSGKIDLIDKITPVDMQDLKQSGEFNFSVSTSTRVMYLFPDSGRTQSPFIRNKRTNKVLRYNPLQDIKVRQAISYAIDRDFLSEQTLGGAGEPNGQLVSKGTRNYIKSIKADKHSPEKAKQLLVDAGYPDGFKLTLHGTNDRYINDELVLIEIGKMLTKVGIETTVVPLPKKEFFSRARNYEFSMSFMGWATSRAKGTLQNVIHTKSETKEFGSWNIGGYNNASINKLIQQMVATRKSSEEYKFIRKATNIAISEKAIIPLYSEKAIWATSNDIAYNGNIYSYTFIKDIYTRK